MGAIKKYIYRRLGFSGNLVIGGVANIITNINDLSNHFDVSIIPTVIEFRIIGNDVHVITSSNIASLNNSAFLNNHDITFIKGNVITMGSLGRQFEGCINLEYAVLPNINRLSSSSFKNCVSLNYDKCNFDSVATVYSSAFLGANGGVNQFLHLPTVNGTTGVQMGAFEGFLGRLKIDNYIGSVWRSFYRFKGILTIYQYRSSNPAHNSNTFQDIDINATINFDIAMQTINNGSPDKDCIYLENRGCTVNYVSQII